MSENSPIEWTDHTFNPWWGCAKVSPACDHCYAERDAARFKPGMVLWGTTVDGASRFVWPEGDEHHITAQANMANAAKHWSEPLRWNTNAAARGVRERVFCASMADVFDNHPAVTEERARLWTLIHKTPALDWLLLTKRRGNVAKMVPEPWLRGHWPKNAWLGISVVNQDEADRDIPKLLALPARVRFLSCEPLLGPIRLGRWLWTCCGNIQAGSEADGLPGGACCNQPERLDDLDWVIAGGESGPKARPAHPDWFRGLRDQCSAAGVPFLFKQWGEWLPTDAEDQPVYRGEHRHIGGHWHAFKVGKKAAGRLLDGVQHDGMPA